LSAGSNSWARLKKTQEKAELYIAARNALALLDVPGNVLVDGKRPKS
jgi:hypothetical protein